MHDASRRICSPVFRDASALKVRSVILMELTNVLGLDHKQGTCWPCRRHVFAEQSSSQGRTCLCVCGLQSGDASLPSCLCRPFAKDLARHEGARGLDGALGESEQDARLRQRRRRRSAERWSIAREQRALPCAQRCSRWEPVVALDRFCRLSMWVAWRRLGVSRKGHADMASASRISTIIGPTGANCA